jgi:hypothetical protein
MTIMRAHSRTTFFPNRPVFFNAVVASCVFQDSFAMADQPVVSERLGGSAMQ